MLVNIDETNEIDYCSYTNLIYQEGDVFPHFRIKIDLSERQGSLEKMNDYEQDIFKRQSDSVWHNVASDNCVCNHKFVLFGCPYPSLNFSFER